MNDWFAAGATAEYCVTQPSSIALKPQRLTHAEAASIPIGALTAWQGLCERAKLRVGERVLIHGGSGAVGVFAIQLAWRAGAQVFTTASARNAGFLEQLGAGHVIDYHAERFEDTWWAESMSYSTPWAARRLRRSWAVLAPGGRMVTIASNREAVPDDRTKAAFFIVEPKPEQLVEIAKLLDAGALKTFVDGIVPLAQAPAAYSGKVARQNGRGKVVVAVVE